MKEFNKANILAFIDEQRTSTKIVKGMAKRKKAEYHFEGWLQMLDILEHNINAIWPD